MVNPFTHTDFPNIYVIREFINQICEILLNSFDLSLSLLLCKTSNTGLITPKLPQHTNEHKFIRKGADNYNLNNQSLLVDGPLSLSN